MQHFDFQGFDLLQVQMLVMENRRHSQNACCYDGQPEYDDGAHAVTPGDFHRSERQTDLQKSQIVFVEGNRFYNLKVPFSSAAIDNLAEKLTIELGLQNQRLFFLLTDTASVGMGYDIQVAIEKRDELTI